MTKATTQAATAASAPAPSIREKVANLPRPETTKEAAARTLRTVIAERDERLRPVPYVHPADGRPLAKLPEEHGSVEVYADTPEYAGWLQLVVVRDWLRDFCADIHGLRVNAAEALERLDTFLSDSAIPEHLRHGTGSRLRYLRAGLNGEPGVNLGTHMTGLRFTVAEAERVVGAVNLPAPPGPLSVVPTEGTGRHYGWGLSSSH